LSGFSVGDRKPPRVDVHQAPFEAGCPGIRDAQDTAAPQHWDLPLVLEAVKLRFYGAIDRRQRRKHARRLSWMHP